MPYCTMLCSVLLILLFSISSSFGVLLEHCWGVFSFEACADLFTFHLFYVQLYVHLLLCITTYMCPFVCLLVHTYVYMGPHMFFFHFLAFICCLICNYGLVQVHFCDLHVYLTCAGMWAIYVFYKTHPFWSKF